MEDQMRAFINPTWIVQQLWSFTRGNKVLREVTGETTAAGVLDQHETLDMTKSLANKFAYLKKNLYTFYMPAGRKISEHIDEFNKIVLILSNIEYPTLRGREILL
ncbi:hypothetical protein Tco_1192470 [Tanacetum coccineum]